MDIIDLTDIELINIKGIEIEKEDRSVGIFGNIFTIVLGITMPKKGFKQLQISLTDDEFDELLNTMKKARDTI